MVFTIHHKKVSKITLTADGNEELPPPRFLFQFCFCDEFNPAEMPLLEFG